ncbi:MAG: hypothetical protein IJB85_05420 [Clostridia bacterium]|nr:hypothetical protein [Clostridia bacterium]
MLLGYLLFWSGGVYLDTDVEITKPLDELLEYEAWFGYESYAKINTGTGFGAVRGQLFVNKLLQQYLSFDCNAKYKTCTVLDTRVFEKELPGFAKDSRIQQNTEGILISNSISNYVKHHYAKSWATKREKVMGKIKAYNALCRLKGSILQRIEKAKLR